MSAFSAYLEQEIGDWVRNVSQPFVTAPTTIYMGLSLADILDDAAGLNEPTGDANYARQAITMTAAGPTNGVGLTLTQSGNIIFPASDAGYGTITHWGIFDAVSAGNLLFHGSFAVSVTNLTGETYSVPDLTISVVIR